MANRFFDRLGDLDDSTVDGQGPVEGAASISMRDTTQTVLASQPQVPTSSATPHFSPAMRPANDVIDRLAELYTREHVHHDPALGSPADALVPAQNLARQPNPPLRILVAPPSFGDCFTATAVADLIHAAIGSRAVVQKFPLSSGGEGFMSQLVKAHRGRWRRTLTKPEPTRENGYLATWRAV